MNDNVVQRDGVIEVDLLEIGYMLLKRWWMILLSAIIGGAAMWVVTTRLITPMYESSATLYILNKTTSITSMADIQIGSELSSDFEVIATSKPVLDGAIEQIEDEEGLHFTRRDLLENLEVSTIDDTRLLVIAVRHEDPEIACIIANAVADVTASRMAQITKSEPPTMAEWAEPAKIPASPSLVKNVVLGVALAILLICVILIIAFISDDNIKTEEDVAKYLDAPILGNISYIDKKERKKRAKEKQKENIKKELLR